MQGGGSVDWARADGGKGWWEIAGAKRGHGGGVKVSGIAEPDHLLTNGERE